jgi:hypothetical protein
MADRRHMCWLPTEYTDRHILLPESSQNWQNSLGELKICQRSLCAGYPRVSNDDLRGSPLPILSHTSRGSAISPFDRAH